MGNAESQPEGQGDDSMIKSFPGSAIVETLTAPCGSLRDTVDDTASPQKNQSGISKILTQAEHLCIQSPASDAGAKDFGQFNDEYEDFRKDKENPAEEGEDGVGTKMKDNYPPRSPANPTSALFARALVSEVTDNPKTMRPAAMAEREKKLLKAQERAKKAGKTGEESKPVGTPGGVGQASVLGSIAHALTGTTDPLGTVKAEDNKATAIPPNSMSENRAQVDGESPDGPPIGKNTITIGLSLSRRSSVGHPDSVTRQTAFDFNELQDREYKYVSSTDSSGWRAGGGEPGGPDTSLNGSGAGGQDGGKEGESSMNTKPLGTGLPGTPTGNAHKEAAQDTVHIPIIHIDAESPEAVDAIIGALARGEIFIPHMAITPEALSVDGVSPPNLVVRFGAERNDDLPPDEWPNWCLEFMHNQLYEYFHGMGARWMKRPFSITLAKKVRWKTVKHMNRYFAHAERVIDAWREQGPQYLDPQLAYIEGGATPEEMSRPHGIYLLRNGVPTNYFAPNFDPPYTTKMTRSLLLNVMGKSWDKKRREWTSEPIPRLVTPAMLVTAMCGCGDAGNGGFLANEVTIKSKIETSNIPDEAIIKTIDTIPAERTQSNQSHLQQQKLLPQREEKTQEQPQLAPTALPQTPAADTDIMSEPVAQTSSPAHSAKVVGVGSNFDTDETGARSTPLSSAAGTPSSFPQLNLQVSSSSADVSKVPTPSSSMRSTKFEQLESPTESRSERNGIDDFKQQENGEVEKPLEPIADNRAPSDFAQPSVTGTNSTVMHMNLSATKLIKRHANREEKKEDPSTLASDEDWLDEMGKPLPSPAIENTRGVTTEVALEQERARQIALVAMAQEQTAKSHDAKAAFAKAAMKSDKHFKRSPKDTPGINKNNSGVSLDYSVDSTYIGDGSTLGGSSLMGGRYATDGSVATASTWAQKKESNTMATTTESQRDDDEVSGFSLQESTASEYVPTDEELFAVGWAKALDPKSGSYYYFTLDRTKIVWDNPLASRGVSMDSAESSLPEGAAVI